MSPNEAREYLNIEKKDGADELKQDTKTTDLISGTSPQDTGGGGGNQVNKMNIGTT
jgi:hypothetical protein